MKTTRGPQKRRRQYEDEERRKDKHGQQKDKVSQEQTMREQDPKMWAYCEMTMTSPRMWNIWYNPEASLILFSILFTSFDDVTRSHGHGTRSYRHSNRRDRARAGYRRHHYQTCSSSSSHCNYHSRHRRLHHERRDHQRWRQRKSWR